MLSKCWQKKKEQEITSEKETKKGRRKAGRKEGKDGTEESNKII